MCSFGKLRDDDESWPEIRAVLDSWPQYRYLDSGAFTLLERGHATRSEVARLFDEYVAFLKAHLADFHFVFDLDLDRLNVGGRPGVELTEEHRQVLRSVAGDKLIPVWHPIAGRRVWESLAREFPYLAIGEDNVPWTDARMAERVSYAHEHGVLVHALGTAKLDLLHAVPYDTCDVTTWLSPIRFGSYGGVDYPPPPGKRYTEKHLRFEEKVRELGYDPATLREEHATTEKLEVAIALLQERQLEVNR